MLDTQAMRKDMNDWRDQVDWLEDGLAASTADWKIVVGHHPMYTAGNHYTGSSTVRNYVEVSQSLLFRFFCITLYIYYSMTSTITSLATKIFNRNFHSLELVSC